MKTGNRVSNKNKNNPNIIRELRILHANINGSKNKHRSIQSAVDLYEANVVTLNETKLRPQKLKGCGT